MEKRKDELIIDANDNIVDMFIILKGKVKISAFPPEEVYKELFEKDKFDIISQISYFKTLKVGQLFGDFSCFSPEKAWKYIQYKGITLIIYRSHYAYPEDDDVELMKIDFKKTKALFEVSSPSFIDK